MPLTISSNSAATSASFNLSKANDNLRKSLTRLSSGQRIVSPSDDAGGLAVGMKLASVLKRSEAAKNNLSNGISFLQVQDGALKVVGSVIDRMSELKAMYNDISKNASDRENYNKEFSELQKQLVVTGMETFNGVSLFTTEESIPPGFQVSTTENGSQAGVVSLNRIGLFNDLTANRMFDGGLEGTQAVSLSSQRSDSAITFAPTTELNRGNYVSDGSSYYITNSNVTAGTYQDIESAVGGGSLTKLGSSHPEARYFQSGGTQDVYAAGDVVYDGSNKKYYVATATVTPTESSASQNSSFTELALKNAYAGGTQAPTLNKAENFSSTKSYSEGDVASYNNKLYVANSTLTAGTQAVPVTTKTIQSITVSGTTATVSSTAHGLGASAPVAQEDTLTLTGNSAAAGETFTATINGAAITYTTAGTAETVTTIAAGLVSAINASSQSGNVTATNAAGVITLTSDIAGTAVTTTTAETGATTTLASATTTANVAGSNVSIGGSESSALNGNVTYTYVDANTYTYQVASGNEGLISQGMMTGSTQTNTGFTELSTYAVGKELTDGSYDLSDFDTTDFIGFIQTLANTRAQNGAEHSRLNFSGDMLDQNMQNLEAARGRIMDADMAQESTRFAKYNVMTQAAASMVAQANSLSGLVLQLLQ